MEKIVGRIFPSSVRIYNRKSARTGGGTVVLVRTGNHGAGRTLDRVAVRVRGGLADGPTTVAPGRRPNKRPVGRIRN